MASNMKLNTIEQDLHKYKEKYNYKDWIVNAQVFLFQKDCPHMDLKIIPYIIDGVENK